MSAEAEVTDILVRVSLEGVEHFFRFSGKLATKGIALLLAGVKYIVEQRKNLIQGGKVSEKNFLKHFVASQYITLSMEDFKKLEPELKRLHIPVTTYKRTKDQKSSGIVDVAVRREDTERFARLCEQFGIASVEPLDMNVEELSAEEYEQSLKQSGAKGVDISASKGGITINEKGNPILAPNDLSSPSVQSFDGLSEDSNPIFMDFDTSKSIEENLRQAKKIADRRAGKLIAISANKERLLRSEEPNAVILTIPGTQAKERIRIPREDIVSMQAQMGQTILADLKAEKSYDILDAHNQPLRKMTGGEIRQSGNWNVPRIKTDKGFPAPPIKQGGGR